MVRRGIVEQVINNRSVRVRVPSLYASADSPYATPTESLNAATVCYQPGVIPTYKVGDIVYIAYNEGDVGSPVIVGMMLTDMETSSVSNITASSVTSNINTKLSSDVTIGDITPSEIQSLSGIRSNIQFQIDLLSTLKTTTYVQLEEPISAREGDLWFCVDYKGKNSSSEDTKVLSKSNGEIIIYEKDRIYRKNFSGDWTDVTSAAGGGDIEALRIRLEGAEQRILDLTLSSEELSLKVSKNATDIATVSVRADKIETDVKSIDTKLDNTTTELESRITQTASAITSEVTERQKANDAIIADYSSKIEQTSKSITSEVAARESAVSALNSSLSEEIKNRLQSDENLQADYNTKITQTAADITSEASARILKENEIIADYSSKISQTATDIRAEVTDSVSKAKSEIKITTDAISSQLSDASGKINKVTQTLDGVVYDNGSGTTVINGSNITTGSINADRLKLTGEITWDDFNSACQARVDQGKGGSGYDDSDVKSLLKRTYQIESTTIDGTTIQSPTVMGGTIIGTDIYSGRDAEYVHISEDGLNFRNANDSNIVRLGYDDDSGYQLPLVWLGGGGGSTSQSKLGTVKKYWNGLWVGEEFFDTNYYFDSDNIPSDVTGIFIDFNSREQGLVLSPDMYGSESEKPTAPMEGQIYFVV